MKKGKEKRAPMARVQVFGCPQGFTTNENKGDITVFHSIPHAIPHTRNKDSYLDLLRTSFWGNLGR